MVYRRQTSRARIVRGDSPLKHNIANYQNGERYRAVPSGVTTTTRVRNAFATRLAGPQIVRKNHPEFVIFSEILLDNLQSGWYYI